MLMLAALLLGGGGSSAPFHNLIIQIAAVALIAWIAWRRELVVRNRAETAALCLLALILLTPLIQTIPMPPSLWSLLPERDLAREVSVLAGGRLWHPLSLDPEASWLSGAFLLVPAAMFLSALRLEDHGRRKIAMLVVAGALFSLVLGGLQIAAGGQLLRLYDSAHGDLPTGLFTNRNHQADLFLVAMLLSAALAATLNRPQVRLWAWLAAMVLFSAGVIATASRAGFVLLPMTLVACLSFLPLRLVPGRRGAALLAAAMLIAVAALIALSAGTQRTLVRFQSLSDVRFEFWSDALLAARLYFPFGSGLGTFDPVYRAVEDLNTVGPQYVNHAHNDYLELLLETGAYGCVLLALFLLLFFRLSLRKVPAEAAPLRKAAAFSILILLAHSVVDYPLRMLSLLCVFGFLCALLLPVPRSPERRRLRA